MNFKSDILSFAKNDQIVTIDVLLSFASALYSSQRVAQKDCDQLKVIVSGLQALEVNRSQSFLSLLIRQDVSFVKLIEEVVGAKGFVNMLFGLVAQKPLLNAQHALADFVQDAANKSELFFNQNFQMRHGEIIQYRAKAPEFLVCFAERLRILHDELSKIRDDLRVYALPAAVRILDGAEIVDKEFALAIGCESSDAPPALQELVHRSSILQLVCCFDKILDLFSMWFEFVSANFKINGEAAENSYGALCFLCRAQVKNLSQLLGFSRAEGLKDLEQIRFEASATLDDICGIVAQLAKTSTAHMNLSSLILKEERLLGQFFRNKQAQSALVLQLCARGVSTSEAVLATKALAQYCQDNNVEPDKLIESEIAKIHPILNDSVHKATLELLTKSGAATQEALIVRSKKLRSFVKEALKATLVIAFFVLFSHCGVKTPVQSDIEILRPTVPFREISAEADSQLENDIPDWNTDGQEDIEGERK